MKPSGVVGVVVPALQCRPQEALPGQRMTLILVMRGAQDFCQMLMAATQGPEGRLELVHAPYADYSLADTFSAQHSAVQYAALISVLNR